MELTLKKIQQLDSEKIYDFLLPTFNNIYQTFKYSEISQQSYYELALKVIETSKITYSGDIPYTEFIRTKIRATLFEYIKKLLNESSTSFKIINNYINQKFGQVSTYEDALKYFKKLDTFFEIYNYIPNLDVLIELINKNDFFKKVVLNFMTDKSKIVI